MEFNHRPFLLATDILCLNNETNKMINPLPNLEHDLGIDNNNIDNPMSLSNILF